MVMLYSNKTRKDILAHEELEHFSRVNVTNLKIHHTLTRHNHDTDGEWEGHRGRITAELLKACGFPEPSPDTLIVYCGPPLMNKTIEDLMLQMGYTKDMLHKF
jgi:NAD(P)H-flavin reductase